MLDTVCQNRVLGGISTKIQAQILIGQVFVLHFRKLLEILLKDVICTTSTWKVNLLCFVCIRFFSWKRREKSEARFTISVWRHRRDLIMHVSHWSASAADALLRNSAQSQNRKLSQSGTAWNSCRRKCNFGKIECQLFFFLFCFFFWRGDTAVPSRCVTECLQSCTWVIQRHQTPCHDLQWPTVNSRVNVLVKVRRDYKDESTNRGETSVFSQQWKINVESGISIVMLARITSCSQNTIF